MAAKKTVPRAFVTLLLFVHAGLVAWIDMRNAPSPDETAHMAAGIVIWASGCFNVYPVNPPLVRLVAAVPAVCSRADANWSSLCEEQSDDRFWRRPEWSMGIGLVRDNRDRIMRLFMLARWACIPFGLIGGYFCWRWAGELYGTWAATLALTLWCFSPNVITWSATICPDLAAASLGIAACYFFWRWLKEPEWWVALLAGIVLGLAQLTKMTWVILFAVWPVVWIAWLWGRRGCVVEVSGRSQALQLVGILTVSLYVLNLGYTFEGTFTRLGDFMFASRTLAGADSVVDGGRGGNRFATSWLRSAPVPLPYNYLRGMDLQKVDFERGLPSYLFGQWSPHGWWHYYLVCAALKEPLGTWALAILAVCARLRWPKKARSNATEASIAETANRRCGAGWLDEIALLLPAIVLIVFVSSQTGFSRHFRYVLPAFPFLFVWIGRVAQVALRKPRAVGVCVAVALTWTVTSSLTIYPHSMSYFNELTGGPLGGCRCLLDSNIDWGQDVLYLKDWCNKHPEATPLHVAFSNSYADALLGLGDRVRNLDDLLKPIGGNPFIESHPSRELGPKPGWYALSVNYIYGRSRQYRYFLNFQPVAMAGYSIYIYHITLEQANRVRRRLGLAELEPVHLLH